MLHFKVVYVYGILYTLVLKEKENETETKKYSSISAFSTR